MGGGQERLPEEAHICPQNRNEEVLVRLSEEKKLGFSSRGNKPKGKDAENRRIKAQNVHLVNFKLLSLVCNLSSPNFISLVLASTSRKCNYF